MPPLAIRTYFIAKSYNATYHFSYMLRQLRDKKTAKRIWIFLAIVIVPAFVLWGSGSLIRGREKTNLAGKIFGKKVSSLDYQDALIAVKNQAVIQFGDNFSEVQKYLNLENKAWERLVLLSEAKRRRIKIDNREVVSLIQSYPFFQKDGYFNQQIYSSMLEYVFRTPARVFEEQARQNIILARLYKVLTDSVSINEEEVKEAYRKNNEEISISYILSLYSDFTKDLTPSQEEIKGYFASNSFKFKKPLSFNMDYASLVLGDNEDQEAMKDKITKILLRLNKKEEFAEVAKDFNLSVKETGLFTQTDPIPGIGWSPKILSFISQVKPGEFLPPIYVDKNYYIARLKERKPPYIPDFETIEDKVREAFIKEEAQKLSKLKIEACLQKLQEIYQINPNSINFDKIAKEYGLRSGSTDLFKYGSYIEGIGASDNFWSVAIGLKQDEFSPVIDVPSGLYIIKLQSKVPIDEKKFETEKDGFAEELLSRKKEEYFTKFLEELKRKILTF
ncbi:MAG: peptidyl-prolyl cis-trans isomerase [Candidatus Omnitrophica bacterium]|nr:peptidyl-prolyl cis-trans isomerase [Candidatus Omnitrophota bacterium]MCG2706444.1 SurA N-terminal domain-containing protein [Candidatus Omnitrophota bacterium]